MELADALVDALIALEVKYVFGVSGANIEHFHDAIHRRGRGRLRSVMSKSEYGAAFMADGHARVNRTLGVCCSTSGGGMMNLMTGIAESYQSSVPVLAIVGQPATSVEGRGGFQDSSGIGRSVDAVAMFGAVSKYVRKIDRPEVFWEAFLDAFATATSGRPGPAVLLIPRSVYTSAVGDVPLDIAAAMAKRVQARSPSEADARAVLDELRLSRRSVLIIGQGVQRTRNRTAVLKFAEAINIPVATTMAARGEFPNDHPNYLGVLGVAGQPSAHAYVRDECDLLFIAGAGLNTMTRAPFARDPVDLPAKRIVAISADLGELERVVLVKPKVAKPAGQKDQRSWWPDAVSSIAVGIEADVGEAFEVLFRLWKEQPFQVRALRGYVPTVFAPTLAIITPRAGMAPVRPQERSAPLGEASEDAPFSHPLAVRLPLPATHGTRGDDERLLQSVALEVLADHLPSQGQIFYDAGNCAAAALHAFSVPRGVTSVIALGMGGMGYAIAAAVGAQLGAPELTRTVVFTGDGSFLMVGLEVHTAVDLKLPILYVVFNNNMHGMCATRQNLFFESRYECVSYGHVDIAQIARGLGKPADLWVGKAATRRQLVDALADFERDCARPGVLELCLAIEEVPPFTPFLDAEAPTNPMRVPPKKE